MIELTSDDFLTIDPVQQKLLIEASHPRSSRWPAFVKKIIDASPFCAFCGSKRDETELVGHHILPYHMFPQLELVESNILVVGETCTSGNHHLFACHFGNFSKWNPDAALLAEIFLSNRNLRLENFEPIKIFTR